MPSISDIVQVTMRVVNTLVPVLVGTVRGGGVQTPVQIFGGTSDAVIWYEFTDPYLTYSGPDVTAAQNVANPGTYDLGLGAAPLAVAGGLDGRDAIECDGVSEYLQVATLPLAAGDTWDMHIVCEYQGTPPAGGLEVIAYTDDGAGTSQVTVNYLSDYGIEYRSTPTGYAPARGGTLDADPHLIAVTTYNKGAGTSNGRLRIDGNVIATASTGEDGTLNGVSRFTVGSTPGGGIPANVRVSEIVLVRNETDGDTTRVAYQNRIGSLYPTIGAALP